MLYFIGTFWWELCIALLLILIGILACTNRMPQFLKGLIFYLYGTFGIIGIITTLASYYIVNKAGREAMACYGFKWILVFFTIPGGILLTLAILIGIFNDKNTV